MPRCRRATDTAQSQGNRPMSIPSNDNTVPSTPTPVPANIIVSVIKMAVVVAGILGITLPAVFSDTGTIQDFAGALALVIGVVWHVIGQFQHAQAVHAAAVASANAGRPVQVARHA